MFNRRKILGGLAAGPLVAKAAAEDLIAKQVNTRIPDIAGHGHLADLHGSSPCTSPPFVDIAGQNQKEAALLRKAWQVPALRKEMESILYEENRYVQRIDPDLAAYRSFSLNAKITFQRQREVQRSLESGWFDEHPYGKKRALLARIGKTFLGLG